MSYPPHRIKHNNMLTIPLMQIHVRISKPHCQVTYLCTLHCFLEILINLAIWGVGNPTTYIQVVIVSFLASICVASIVNVKDVTFTDVLERGSRIWGKINCKLPSS